MHVAGTSARSERINLNQVTLPATDVARSVTFYREMGFTLIVDSPHYARFECPDGDATFSIHAVEPPACVGAALLYFECSDLDARVALLQSRGIRFTQLPTDQRWLWREARLLDPDGNKLCLYHAGANRRHPPWRVGS